MSLAKCLYALHFAAPSHQAAYGGAETARQTPLTERLRVGDATLFLPNKEQIAAEFEEWQQAGDDAGWNYYFLASFLDNCLFHRLRVARP
jgi:hypothetical protein